MGYDDVAVTATTTAVSKMDYAYSTRPLTDDERLLVRLWRRHRIFTAGLVLLTMRMECPKYTMEELDELPPPVLRAYLLGLAESVERDFNRQEAMIRLDRMDPTQERAH